MLSAFPHALALLSIKASSVALASVWTDTWTFGISSPALTSLDCSNFNLEAALEETMIYDILFDL